MARKSVPIKSALAPQPLRYAAGKPGVPASVETRPVDDDSMSDGSTGGNFQQPDVAVGAGFATQQGIDPQDPNK